MSRLRLTRPSAPMVVSCLALFVALSGSGVAVAAVVVPKHSVGTAQLKASAVTSGKLRTSAVTGSKIKDNAVSSAKIKSNAVTGAKIKAGSVTSSDIADKTLTGADIKDGTLAASDFQANQFRQGPRAYGTITDTIEFQGSHPGLLAVTRPATGTYCITPGVGVPSSDAHAQATVDWYYSMSSDNSVQVLSGLSECAAGQLEVHTYTGAGILSDNVGFSFLVP